TLLGRRDLLRRANEALWRAAILRKVPRLEASGKLHPDLASWTLAQGGADVEGGLGIDFSSSLDQFQIERRIGDFTLYRYERALPRFHVVEHAVVAEDDASSLRMVVHPDFDPERIVVLSGVDPSAVAAHEKSGNSPTTLRM